MLSMQKIAMLALALTVSMVAIPQVGFAQDATTSSASGGPGGGRGGRGGGMGRGGAMFKAALDLTDLSAEQKEKITALQKEQTDKNKAAYDKMQSGEQPSTEDRAAMREKMMAQNKEYREKVEAILNEDQKKKFDEAMKAMPQRQFGGGNRGTSATSETKMEAKTEEPKAETK